MKRLGMVAIVVAYSSGCSAHPNVVSDTQVLIKTESPSAAVNRLVSNEGEWNAFLKRVQDGDQTALTTAEALMTVR